MRRLLALIIVGGLATSAGAATTFVPPPFPRLATYWSGNQSYQNPTVQKALARGSVAVINVWPGWEVGAGMSVQQVITDIKSINPNTLVFNYVANNEIPKTDTVVRAAEYTELNLMSWFLYASGGSGSILDSAWQGDYAVNNTLFTPTDANGNHWVDWFANWATKQYAVPNPGLDGFFTDNVMWRPRVDGDYNRDGTIDSANDPKVGTWLRTGERQYFLDLQKLMPGKYQLGNVDYSQPGAVFPELDQVLNGGLMEGAIGYAWSAESWSGWAEMMRQYRVVINSFVAPKLAIFGQVGSATDYQGFRYGLASCLMDDGYFNYNSSSGYGDSPSFDEYTAHLGASTSVPQTAAWQKGVYRRDFANGIALVNPKGNGIQTVTLETSFKHLTGSQAPSINNGQVVTSVTLQDRDGIILLRNKTQTKPLPPSGVKLN